MCRHGMEYSTLATEAWMSGPTFAVRHSASTNSPAGNAASVPFSAASNTASGLAPSSGRQARRPATSVHQRSPSDCMCAREVNSRPRQKLSRIYGIGRSTCGLSRGFRERAGSIRQP